ncbi:granzyme B-like isoform X2 [Cololabis saira]|nr:granzyme B-like isoform X2 [Cololabis saira]XP_061580306.1 granzyme B-like isoform X2 [Cololabis saira]
MASLQFGQHHSCGGVLIREDYVLTAAHCKFSSNYPMTVVLGAHNISKREKSQQRIDVAKYHKHPAYTEGSYDWDIMLLKLRENATINKFVKAIGLPRKEGRVPANVACVVAGWGKTGANKPSSVLLKEAKEKIQFSVECKNKWKQYFNSKNMICTTFDKKNGGICQGDSGGPLICNSKPQGITAFTVDEACDDPNYPHVFTKIHAFLPWIKDVMRE